jgi:peptide/nickel transport system permease protein
MGFRSQFYRNLWSNKSLFVGTVVVALLLFLALFRSWIVPYDPFKQHLEIALQSVSFKHLLGTDEFGRDMLSRIIFGSRITLTIVCTSVFLGGIFGCFLGVIAGYLGRSIDAIIMRLMDIPLAFPGMLLALTAVEIVGKGVVGLIIATSIYSVPQFARLARACILSTRESLYVKGARALGENDFNIIWRYILPNIWAPILVLASIRAAIVVLVACALSFLGLGIQPPAPEWGSMIAEGKMYLVRAPHLTLFPGLAITVTVFGLNLLADALRDIMDVKLS